VTFLNTPPESPLYRTDLDTIGYVANYTRVFVLRPEAYLAWQQLAGVVRDGMDLRRYELATLAAARSLGSAYCSLAHASVLRDKFYDDDALRAIVADHHDAGLDPVDVAIMDFAARAAVDPASADPAALRGHGLSDVDIFQIVLAVNIRRFFSGVLSAVDAEPDRAYESLDAGIRRMLP
jgi:uncharacterized peroxidase-related enzyme